MPGQLVILGANLCGVLRDIVGAQSISLPDADFEVTFNSWEKERWTAILLNPNRLRGFITGLPDVVLVALDNDLIDTTLPCSIIKFRVRTCLKKRGSDS